MEMLWVALYKVVLLEVRNTGTRIWAFVRRLTRGSNAAVIPVIVVVILYGSYRGPVTNVTGRLHCHPSLAYGGAEMER